MNSPSDKHSEKSSADSTKASEAALNEQPMERRDDLVSAKTTESDHGSSSVGSGALDKLKAILQLPNDSTKKTLTVTVLLCLVCSILVAGAAVVLRPLQASNAAADRQRNIVEVAGLLGPGVTVEQAFQKVERRIVDLETGEFTDKFMDDPSYNQYEAARDPELGHQIPASEDIAGIGRRARYAEVFLVGGDDFEQIILPINGKGLWSTLYGFVSLDKDLQTIAGLSFYSQQETAGLGAEVANPVWQAKWKGKKIDDDSGEIKIEVIKGVVDEQAPDSVNKVDGLAGATLTSRGVTHLMHYWLDEEGFGPFLKNLRQQGA